MEINFQKPIELIKCSKAIDWKTGFELAPASKVKPCWPVAF
jgi:hypothetical protein